jgi:site-specific recombinase XerD
MLGALHTMFIYMQRHEWEGAPVRLLIYDEDRPKPIKRRPRPLPQAVFEQLEAHVDLLPPYSRNLMAILSVAGLRAEDALHLSENCLDYDAAGDPRLLWFNHKMKRDGRPLPITTEVAEAIQRQRELVREIPDIFGKHYLFRTKRGLYRFARFCAHLNETAQKGPILGEGGQIYHFKPHQFRHMVGTGMINNGMGIADVMAYLDHMSPEMTLQYAEIDDDKLKQKFKALVLSGQAVGGAALKALKEQLEKGDESELDWVVSNLRKLSLPWGQCLHHAKANKCPYGQNACFTKDNGPCHKLVTTPEHAPVIIATMQDLKRSKQIADDKGWEMYANDLADQINGMQQVLTELQLPADQRAKNRGGAK